MARMRYSPNRKCILATMEYTHMVYSSNEKGTALSKILFRGGKGNGNWLMMVINGNCTI